MHVHIYSEHSFYIGINNHYTHTYTQLRHTQTVFNIFCQCTIGSQPDRVSYRLMFVANMQKRLILGAVISFAITIFGALLAWFIIPPIVSYMVDQVYFVFVIRARSG